MLSETTIKYISMATLLIAGTIMIYEGASYVQLKQSNPAIPDKIYAAAVLAIVLGVTEIAFGIYHFFIKTA
jgi:hypothetical protein